MDKMKSFKLEKYTSISTVIAEFIKQLRLYGPEYVRSGGDIKTVDPDVESQEYVAKALKIQKAAYSKIENGDVAISVYHLSQLCVGYEITLAEFMARVDEKTKELEDSGIQVLNVKIDLRLDHLRWKEKINEKSEASFNKAVREHKKNKTYTLLSDADIQELKRECLQNARIELEKKYDLGEALAIQALAEEKARKFR